MSHCKDFSVSTIVLSCDAILNLSSKKTEIKTEIRCLGQETSNTEAVNLLSKFKIRHVKELFSISPCISYQYVSSVFYRARKKDYFKFVCCDF